MPVTAHQVMVQTGVLKFRYNPHMLFCCIGKSLLLQPLYAIIKYYFV